LKLIAVIALCFIFFPGDGEQSCDDIDECDRDMDDCATQAICTNTEGNYT